MSEEPYISGALRCGVAAGYTVLLAVNGIFGSGAFGVATNAELSAAYPSPVTPAGFTFAIWGPIFLLQAGGVGLICSGRAPSLAAAVAVPWLAAWFWECAWQLVFAQLPLDTGSDSVKLAILVPAAIALIGAQASMLWGSVRVFRSREAPAGASASESLLVALPTGVNAAWLAAATGIGLSLVAKIAAPPLGSAQGGAALLSSVVVGAAVLAPMFLRRSKALGAGYAAATIWACFGITKGDSPNAVKRVARVGGLAVAAAFLLVLAYDTSAAPGADPEKRKPPVATPADTKAMT